MNINSNDADMNGQMPENSNPPGQMPTTPHGQMPTGPAKTPIAELPENAQDYVRSLRGENKGLRTENAALREQINQIAQAQKQAEQDKLAEQGQFRQLAEQHAARVKELEPIAARYNTLASQIRAQIQVETKDWPPELKALVPGEGLAAEEQLEAIEKLRPVLKKLQEQARGSVPGNRPDPKPLAMTPEQTRQEQLEKLRATGKYGNF